MRQFWSTNVRGKWEAGGDCEYLSNFVLSTFPSCSTLTGADTFDVLLTRDLTRAHIVDFNIYALKTDPLLFTYEELFDLLTGDRSSVPQFKVIDSRTHPTATRNAPTHQHNMIPFEALSLSTGRDVQQFSEVLQEEIQKSQE